MKWWRLLEELVDAYPRQFDAFIAFTFLVMVGALVVAFMEVT